MRCIHATTRLCQDQASTGMPFLPLASSMWDDTASPGFRAALLR